MSLVQLRVELPAYSHSFNIQIPTDGTVFSIKQEISRVCPGNPRVEDQRLVWRGRYLTDDERVYDLWKSLDEPRVIHLAVHPSGWCGAPPSNEPVQSASILSPTASSSSELPSTMPPSVSQSPQNFRTTFDPLSHPHSSGGSPIGYIQWKHDNAICALMYGWTNPWHDASSIHAVRSSAVSFVRSRGYEWPTVLDEEFPAPTPGGVKYEYKIIDGLPYLSLSDLNSSPTPFQLFAVKVLSYTFTLLSLGNAPTPTIPPIATNSTPVNAPPDLNAMLQQLGLPALRVQQPQPAINNNDNPDRIFRELRDVAVRPLLVPLVFLVFRTCLLLYFVAPARKPVFGMLILAWMLYEIWQPVRNAFLRNVQRFEDQQRPNLPGAGGAGDNGAVNIAGGDRQQQEQQPQAQHAEPPANGVHVRAPGVHNGGSLFDVLANVNLDAEQQVLNMIGTAPLEEPSFWRKSLTFLTLLITTVHPAVWNRRRAALQRREGQLRTEANLRGGRDEELHESEDREGDMRRREVRNNARVEHARRPQWVRRYVDRVVWTEWLDMN